MQYYPISLSAAPVAADTTAIETAGVFVRYDEETSGATSNKIIFKTDNGDSFTLKPGQSVELERQFKRITLENKDKLQNLTGTVVVSGIGRVNDSNILGNLTLTGPAIGVAHTPAKKTATNASTAMLAANANRKYLCVQCPSTAANSVFINTGGIAAVADATSFELVPGMTWEPAVAPVGAINMIRGGATNVDLQVIEA